MAVGCCGPSHMQFIDTRAHVKDQGHVQGVAVSDRTYASTYSMFETHHSIYLHKYLNMFDHQQPHPVCKGVESYVTCINEICPRITATRYSGK